MDNTKKARLRPITGVVAKAVQETSDTWTLHIFVGEEDRDYSAGQFISISPHQFPELAAFVAYLEHKKGKKELVRAYSMASTPHEPYVSITIKPEHYYPEECEYPPLLSPLLASDALLGRTITFTGYSGGYIFKDEHAETTKEVLHFVAGSGVVPNYALLKDQLLLDQHPHVRHVMIDVNKTYGDIIFQRELDELYRKYPNRFKLIHMLTREENPGQYGAHYIKGRPTLEQVKGLIEDPASLYVYACGAAITKWQRKVAKETGVEPQPRFMETVTDIVTALGVDKKRYKREVYG